MQNNFLKNSFFFFKLTNLKETFMNQESNTNYGHLHIKPGTQYGLLGTRVHKSLYSVCTNTVRLLTSALPGEAATVGLVCGHREFLVLRGEPHVTMACPEE